MGFESFKPGDEIEVEGRPGAYTFIGEHTGVKGSVVVQRAKSELTEVIHCSSIKKAKRLPEVMRRG